MLFIFYALDEWISFLKTDEIPENAKAPGLAEARELLKREVMDKAERQAYDAHLAYRINS